MRRLSRQNSSSKKPRSSIGQTRALCSTQSGAREKRFGVALDISWSLTQKRSWKHCPPIAALSSCERVIPEPAKDCDVPPERCSGTLTDAGFLHKEQSLTDRDTIAVCVLVLRLWREFAVWRAFAGGECYCGGRQSPRSDSPVKIVVSHVLPNVQSLSGFAMVPRHR